MANNTYLLDANIFITPYKTYYAFDLVPKFWSCVEDKFKNGNITILDKVYDELAIGRDALSNWLANINPQTISCNDPAIVSAYAQVINHIQTCGYYNRNALTNWSSLYVADPWLIACAIAYGYTIVTLELPDGRGLSAQKLSKNPKIPDVCNALHVSCINLFSMMRRLSVSL